MTYELPFPSTPILDDFNRDDGGLGDNWFFPIESASENTFRISTNKLTTSLGEAGTSGWINSLYAPFEVYVDYPFDISKTLQIYFCIQSYYPDPKNFYLIGIVEESVNLNFYIARYIDYLYPSEGGGGTLDFIVNENILKPAETLNGIGVRKLVDGNIQFFWKLDNVWSLLTSIIDTTFSYGKAGIYLDDGNITDNFGGGTMPNQVYNKISMGHYALPSFPATPILDDFNRSNGALGDNWTTGYEVLTINGNKASLPAGEPETSWSDTAVWNNYQSFTLPVEFYVDILIGDDSQISFIFFWDETQPISLYFAKLTSEMDIYGTEGFIKTITSVTSVEKFGFRLCANKQLLIYSKYNESSTWLLVGKQHASSASTEGSMVIEIDGGEAGISSFDNFGGGSF